MEILQLKSLNVFLLLAGHKMDFITPCELEMFGNLQKFCVTKVS